jgi:hypothetical protein
MALSASIAMALLLIPFTGDDSDSNYMRWSAGMTAQFAHGVSGSISYDMLGSYGNLNYETVSLGLSWEAIF